MFEFIKKAFMDYVNDPTNFESIDQKNTRLARELELERYEKDRRIFARQCVENELIYEEEREKVLKEWNDKKNKK